MFMYSGNECIEITSLFAKTREQLPTTLKCIDWCDHDMSVE